MEGTPGLVDYDHFFKVEEGTVTRKDSTLTVRLFPRDGRVPSVNGFRKDLAKLTLEVRLDVNGDGDPFQGGEDASLIVPTTKTGKRWVRFTFAVGKDEVESLSYVKDFLV